jgi:hypothetical protein
MRNPSGAGDIGSEGVGVDIAGRIVGVKIAGVKLWSAVAVIVTVGTDIVAPHAINITMVRNKANILNICFNGDIICSISTSKKGDNWLKRKC